MQSRASRAGIPARRGAALQQNQPQAPGSPAEQGGPGTPTVALLRTNSSPLQRRTLLPHGHPSDRASSTGICCTTQSLQPQPGQGCTGRFSLRTGDAQHRLVQAGNTGRNQKKFPECISKAPSFQVAAELRFRTHAAKLPTPVHVSRAFRSTEGLLLAGKESLLGI